MHPGPPIARAMKLPPDGPPTPQAAIDLPSKTPRHRKRDVTNLGALRLKLFSDACYRTTSTQTLAPMFRHIRCKFPKLTGRLSRPQTPAPRPPADAKSPFSEARQWRITMPVDRGHHREECRTGRNPARLAPQGPAGRILSTSKETQGEDSMYVLEARDLRKSFGEGEAAVEALKGVNLGVQAGEMLAIMGRSGSGKSTMLTLLGGVDVPTSGQVLLEGTDLASLDDDGRTLIRRRRIGFVFQAFNLLP